MDANGQPQTQTIARGPVAAMITIKHFGTNGGGFFGANSAHPFENPNAWTDFIEIVSYHDRSRSPAGDRLRHHAQETGGTPSSSTA